MIGDGPMLLGYFVLLYNLLVKLIVITLFTFSRVYPLEYNGQSFFQDEIVKGVVLNWMRTVEPLLIFLDLI